MLRNYFKITLRNLFRSKILSSINIFGLSLGIGTAILIGVFVLDELTFDSFHINANRIYRPWTKAARGDREMVNTATPFVLGKQLQENYPEVERYTVYTSFSDQVTYEDVSFNENVTIVSADFFDMFTFKPVSGKLEGALDQPNEIVITREMALKYFGTAQSGKLLRINVGNREEDFVVKAVVEDIPGNSSLQFDMVVSDHYLKEVFPEQMLTSWFMITGDTYVMLAEGADPKEVESKFPSLVEQVVGERLEQMSYAIHLQPLENMHLDIDLGGGNTAVMDPKYIVILSSIALLVVIIAGINFVTLSLGRSISRAREIGIRKSMGAVKPQLMWQFMGEALLVTLFATAIGLVLAILALPTFNELAGKALVMPWSATLLAGLVGITLLVGILAGFYPALIMSGFNPVRILRGTIQVGKGKHQLRSILVTGQFIISIFLITTTLIMKNQLAFLQNKNLGFDKEHVLVVPINAADARGVRDQIAQGITKGRTLQTALNGKSGIISSALTSHTFEPGNWTNVSYQEADETQYSFFMNTVTAEYVSTLGIEVIRGRDFDVESDADRTRSVLVNEAFVELYGFENPVGERIPNENFADHEIIGVVRDFHIESLHAEIQPLMLTQNAEIGFSGARGIGIGSSAMPKLLVKIAPEMTSEVISQVNATWNQVYPGEPFDYDFIDERLRQQYEAETNYGRIMTSATVLAVAIGCLGLFGLSMLMMQARLKEVGIRKVLGASTNHLMMTLNTRFVVLVLIALVFASPMAWYFVQDWLSEFQYRVPLTPWIFIGAGLITIVISLITVSFQALRAIRANPANTLRVE